MNGHPAIHSVYTIEREVKSIETTDIWILDGVPVDASIFQVEAIDPDVFRAQPQTPATR